MNDYQFTGTDNYKVDPELGAMVNMAIARSRPLLVTGEAGTGKTQLAYAIAKSMNADLHHAQMTSTMEGEEVCYVYDSILRMTDSQLTKDGTIDGRTVSNPMDYVRFGALGRGLTSEKRSVVLLDEIDKTDSDVQDDLLRVLETYQFEVREANKVVEAKHKPVVIITSNGKRELSDAFLRRTYAHHIDFPDSNALGNIVAMHYPTFDAGMRAHAILIVEQLREAGLEKAPATSELLEWVGCLDNSEAEVPRTIYGGDKIPFVGALVKRSGDLKKVREGAIGRRGRHQRHNR